MKKYLFGLASVIAAFVLSSFIDTINDEEKPMAPNQVGVQYFRFTRENGSEQLYEDPLNWIALPGLPATTPCTVGTADICVAHIDMNAAGISPIDSDQVKVQKFTTYLTFQSSALVWLFTAGNFDYKRL